MSQKKVILLLGSNLGNPKKNIENALYSIEKEIGIIQKKSFYLFSEPEEFGSNNIFCNIAIKIETTLSPIELLNQLKNIEKKMGREEDSFIFGEYRDRIIDIDIVSYNELKYACRKLTIPHLKHKKRNFSIKLLKSIDEI